MPPHDSKSVILSGDGACAPVVDPDRVSQLTGAHAERIVRFVLGQLGGARC